MDAARSTEMVLGEPYDIRVIWIPWYLIDLSGLDGPARQTFFHDQNALDVLQLELHPLPPSRLLGTHRL
jgi:hypothetical protein